MQIQVPALVREWTDTPRDGREIVGVLGGMGGLASAEFLKTIYETEVGEREQDGPVVMLFSDPSFPDRTESFLAGHEEVVLEPLVRALERMRASGASSVVMCCMTLHHLLPRLPPALRERVVSLLDVLMEELANARGRYLLVCSTGTRQLGLFDRHPRWDEVRGRVILADPDDQRRIHHDLIYPVKRNAGMDGLVRMLDELIDRYAADGFIVGCSEVHVLAKHYFATLDPERRRECIDPLAAVANAIREGALGRALAVPS
ncbi:MAG TPA: aspartate/glutamate racemase family protein [Longimicrobium sp.]|jgi:aspartate racemase|uniref:aspartate/glutamate racemase family protein n=1 Tax=Longimicrobium sp. TaxID=2029185 RepID=UPI002ED926FA